MKTQIMKRSERSAVDIIIITKERYWIPVVDGATTVGEGGGQSRGGRVDSGTVIIGLTDGLAGTAVTSSPPQHHLHTAVLPPNLPYFARDEWRIRPDNPFSRAHNMTVPPPLPPPAIASFGGVLHLKGYKFIASISAAKNKRTARVWSPATYCSYQ